MNISPIKFSNDSSKNYPSPMSKRLSPLSIIHSFQMTTLNLFSSPQNYCHWYSIAVSLIKLIDFPISRDSDSLDSILRTLPPMILETASKPNATEGFRSTCGVILNLLSKAGLVNENMKDPVVEFLASLFKQCFRKPLYNSSPKKSQKTNVFDGFKEEALFSEKKKQYGLDCFLDICRIQNEKNISVSVCDEFGRFVICDKLAENIFENKKEVLLKMSLFDMMIPLSFEYLRRKAQKESLKTLQEINSEGVFSYTIYSQNAKKKYLKFLNKYRQEFNHSKINNQNKNDNVQIDSEPTIKGVELFYKFLKGLTSRVRRVEVKLDRKIIEELANEEVNQEYPFIINKKHPFIETILSEKNDEEKEIVLDVALLETRIAKHIQKFDYLYMKFDPKIKNQEEKIQNKMKKKLKKSESQLNFQKKTDVAMNMKQEIDINHLRKNEDFQNFEDF